MLHIRCKCKFEKIYKFLYNLIIAVDRGLVTSCRIYFQCNVQSTPDVWLAVGTRSILMPIVCSFYIISAVTEFCCHCQCRR